MRIVAGPFAIACTLLAIGGFAKARRPGDTAHALTLVGFPLRPATARAVVRVGGAAEAVLAVAAAVTGSPVAAACIAVSYLAFATFVVVALRRGAPISSCGCFGAVDTPPSVVHVVLDVVLAGSAAAAASGGVALADVVTAQPLAAVPFVALVAVGSYLVFVALTLLPRTLAAAQGSAR